ncbi:hypothetical protein HY571_00080, partial [Candidatus Micrarchaeota archaeon]|nr:hypothetical protein [Candidatus Micrarchaeota archaeon]
IDNSHKTPGYKYNYWELKGVPIRIEIGSREAKEKTSTLVRRDNREKTTCSLKELGTKVKQLGEKLDEDLLVNAELYLKQRVKPAKTKEEVLQALDAKCYAKTFICSTEEEGAKCGGELQAFTKGGKVRGELIGEKGAKGKCIWCDKPGVQVYVARQY